MKLVGLFSLATGALYTVVCGTLRNAEHALFTQIWSALISNFDVLLGDRNFGSFATFRCHRGQVSLFYNLARHFTTSLRQAASVSTRVAKRLTAALIAL